MEAELDALGTAFSQLDRRRAVFDRAMRERHGQWELAESVPVEDIIAQFSGRGEFVIEDGKVLIPLHEADSAALTGEYVVYYGDHLVPGVVYYDFGEGEPTRIGTDAFGRTYPAWRLRFWHEDYEPPETPPYLAAESGRGEPATQDSSVASQVSLPDEGAAFLETIQGMIADQEMADREGVREQFSRLRPEQFLDHHDGIPSARNAGVVTDGFGQQAVRFRVDEALLKGPADIPDQFGVYEGMEVIVGTQDRLEGFPAEGEVLDIEGRDLAVAMYWDRGPENPDPAVFEADRDNTFTIGALLNPVPFDRKRDAVSLVSEDDRKRGWLAGTATVSFATDLDRTPGTSRLNEHQYTAAHAALQAEDFYCIHGPPGTGKTRTLVEIIKAAAADGQRVLACSHSNQATDNLLVGDSTADRADPASIHAAVEAGTLSAARVGNNSSSDLVAEEYTDADPYQSDVVCATMSGADFFGEDIFDLVVIDEATQASIPASLIPLSRGKRVVLAGDHNQLPPYYSGETYEEESMAVSLFEHLLELYGEDVITLLRTQYRMNEAIAAFPNEAFYNGQLLHAPKNRQSTIGRLPPLEAIDVSGEERQTPGNSYYNEAEVEVVTDAVDRILRAGARPEDVGVIAPYSGQVGKIRAALRTGDVDGGEDVTVATVDSFQGSERDAIVISFVRSNPQGNTGFLTFPNEGPRRLNVALTRAKRRCVLVGDFDTLRTRSPHRDPEESAADIYQDLYEHLQDAGVLESR